MDSGASAAANSAETVQVNFTLAMGEARLNASVPVPAGATNVTALLPVLQVLTNSVVGAAAARVEAAGEKVSCRAGCGACCRQLVPLSLFEAEALALWIGGLDGERQRELEQRFHAALRGLQESGLLERMTPELWEEGSASARAVVLDYLAAKVACPFLEDESCSIHPIRPLVCREYLVTTPPEFCAAPKVGEVQGVVMPVKLSKALYALGAQVESGSVGWIPLVFLWHWMKSGAEPGKRVAGPGPQVLYAVMAELQG
jgi:Fe-S-cluster containining protein